MGERYGFFWNKHLFLTDQRNYFLTLKPKEKEISMKVLLLSLNSTIDRLFIEGVQGNVTGSYTIIELPVIDVEKN